MKYRLGIDYEKLRETNPRLVYASISGFGQDGPYEKRPGFDQIAQGMGGLMSITGLPGQGPVRAGIPIGCMVSLRGNRMYEFLDRLISFALPQVRDVRAVSPRSFDGRGNYSLGISDQTIFPEIEVDKVKRQQGMDITIVTSARTDAEALDLLSRLGLPFAGQEDND